MSYGMYSKRSTMVNVNNRFNDKLFRELFNQKKDTMVYSPYSINFIMTMVYQGMNGETRREFERVYGLEEDGDHSGVFDGFLAFDKSIQSDELKSGNAQFLDQTCQTQITEEFMNNLAKADYSIELCDFVNNSSGETTRINEWISERTNGLIPNLLNDGDLTSDTRMALVNTLYLKMRWMYPFCDSCDREFTKMNSETTQLKMMYMEDNESMQYYEDNDRQMVLLPYKFNNFYQQYSMGIILPKTAGEFELVENVEQYVAEAKRTLVSVSIPKFESEHRVELSSVFSDFGLQSAFERGNCDLSRLTKANDLYVDKIIHMAKIIVDEDGTEAAAATAVLCCNECYMPDFEEPKIFRANHTFQYFIMHNETRTILFSGVFNG